MYCETKPTIDYLRHFRKRFDYRRPVDVTIKRIMFNAIFTSAVYKNYNRYRPCNIIYREALSFSTQRNYCVSYFSNFPTSKYSTDVPIS